MRKYIYGLVAVLGVATVAMARINSLPVEKSHVVQFRPCVWPNTCKQEPIAQFQPCVWPNRCKASAVPVTTCVWPNRCAAL